VNKTCYSGSLSASYAATVSPPKNYVYGTHYTINLAATTFKLRTTASGAGGTVLLTNTGGTLVGSTVSGNFNMTSLAPDVYTIYASVTVVDIPSGGTSYVLTTTTTFTIGFETVWEQMLDMQALPNNYSCKRAITTGGVTYSRAISANVLGSAANGWFDIGAQFGANTGSVYVVIGKTTTAITNPTTQANYIEFRRTGASTGGIYVKTGGTVYQLSTVIFSDRIRMVVNRAGGGTIQFYKSNATTALTGPPNIVPSGEYNLGVFAANLNDGITSALASFNCVFENQFFYLKDEVEQSIAYVAGSKLKFKYNEDYFDVNGNLNYTIKCLNDDVAPTLYTVTKPTHTNWIEITLGAGGVPITAGNIYLIQVTDTKGRKQYLKFKKA